MKEFFKSKALLILALVVSFVSFVCEPVFAISGPNTLLEVRAATSADTDCTTVSKVIDLRGAGDTIFYITALPTNDTDLINADICIYPVVDANDNAVKTQYIKIDMNGGSDISAGYWETERAYRTHVGIALTTVTVDTSDGFNIFYKSNPR